MKTHKPNRLLLALLAGAGLSAPLAVVGCNKDESVNRTTTTKTTQTPDGVKQTTETTEKKVEVEHKNP